jgi:hypothetical protein
MPREVLETLLETLLATDSASQRVTDLLKRAQPITQSTLTTLRLLWQSRRLLSLCEEIAAVPETLTLRGQSGPWWSGAAFIDLRRGDDCLILEGHGLNAMVSASLGTRAEFAAQGHGRTGRQAGGEVATRGHGFVRCGGFGGAHVGPWYSTVAGRGPMHACLWPPGF